MKPDDARRRPYRSTVLWGLGIALAIVTTLLYGTFLSSDIVFIATASPASSPLVLGAFVIDNPPLATLFAITIVGIILIPVATVVRWREEEMRSKAPRKRGRVVATGITSVLTLLIAIPSLALTALLTISSPYLLPKRSQNGSRVLVIDRAFLLIGKGDVYPVPAHSVVAQHIGTYTTDDGYNPVAHGDYRLSWDGEHPDLQLGNGMGGRENFTSDSNR